ncbi:hypothetical protein EJ06DRAFT_47001 [Trichodelitschia bisporula]|uniref:Uncharacterized protein n=1 Tax=Trichodelitschia bisporula TaxID=703511 RepID=A0A6G1HWJ4_9PEZI|nr:hypothetical protein EJ06DRAFT_47001 [Trichodelitschia bisporula]
MGWNFCVYREASLLSSISGIASPPPFLFAKRNRDRECSRPVQRPTSPAPNLHSAHLVSRTANHAVPLLPFYHVVAPTLNPTSGAPLPRGTKRAPLHDAPHAASRSRPAALHAPWPRQLHCARRRRHDVVSFQISRTTHVSYLVGRSRALWSVAHISSSGSHRLLYGDDGLLYGDGTTSGVARGIGAGTRSCAPLPDAPLPEAPRRTATDSPWCAA